MIGVVKNNKVVYLCVFFQPKSSFSSFKVSIASAQNIWIFLIETVTVLAGICVCCKIFLCTKRSYFWQNNFL